MGGMGGGLCQERLCSLQKHCNAPLDGCAHALLVIAGAVREAICVPLWIAMLAVVDAHDVCEPMPYLHDTLTTGLVLNAGTFSQSGHWESTEQLSPTAETAGYERFLFQTWHRLGW